MGKLEEAVKKAAPPESFATNPLKLNRLSRTELEKIAKAVLAFGEAMFDLTLYPYQVEFSTRFLMSLLLNDGDEITGLFSRQSGKTETIALTASAAMVMLPTLAQYIPDPRIQKFKRGLRVGIFAPTIEQGYNMHSRMNARFRSQRAAELLQEIGIDQDEVSASLALPNGSLAKVHSAAKQARIEGPSYHIIISDESQDIDPKVFRKSISPMGAAVNATQVKIGTCNMLRSDFYEACQRNVKHDMHLKKGQMRNHFQFDYQVAAEHNPFYRKYVQKEIERLGYDTDEFRMAYRLHWILERGMFVDPTAFELLGGDYSPITYDPANEVMAGIDVGKTDASTVVTVMLPDYARGQFVGEGDFRCHKKLLNWLELKGDDYVAQLRQICDFLRNFKKLRRIYIDATGVGQVVYDMLKAEFVSEIENGNLEIIEFIASPTSNHNGYHRMLLDLQNERVEYPNSERARKFQKQRNFVLQMTNLQKEYRGAYLSAEAGTEVAYKDYASSLMLALWACDYTETSREIEEMPNVLLGSDRGRRQRGRAWWN